MNKVEKLRKLNETELELGIAGTSASWHQKYESHPFIYVGGLPTAFTEGDLLVMFEQFGIVVHINLVRDADTGKSRGFAFLKYHDPRSAILAVDNFNGTEVAGCILRVDHAEHYKMPEDGRSGTIDTTPPELKPEHTARMTIATAERDRDSEMHEIQPVGKKDKDAEARREKAVLERLHAMRKRREREERKLKHHDAKHRDQSKPTNGSELGNSVNSAEGDPENPSEASSHERHLGVSESRIEKRRRKQERRERKAERARIREERKRRRAEREEKR